MYDVRWKREDVGLSSSFLSRIGELEEFIRNYETGIEAT
jgi:hypothetical protein